MISSKLTITSNYLIMELRMEKYGIDEYLLSFLERGRAKRGNVVKK